MAHAHNMATAITGSTAEGGSITRLESAEVSRLESTEDAGRGMPATCTDISGGSTKLEIKWLRNAMVASGATYMTAGNTGVASKTAEASGMAAMMAGDSGVAAMLRSSSPSPTVKEEPQNISIMYVALVP